MANYEVEIKSLLGDQRNAIDLVAKMKETDPGFIYRGKHKQLNHYFVGGNMAELQSRLKLRLPEEQQIQFDDLASKVKDFSIRTRLADTLVLFVIKATVDDTSSSNGISRQEFEAEVDMKLDELDQLLLESGFEYQAKWSRERDEYAYKGMNVTVDKNAGYGYLAEFETMVDDQKKTELAKVEIVRAMKELGVAELPQDRLQRMFDYYNEHWREYYGSDNTFNIE